MSKPNSDEELYDLNKEYQTCLNKYYDLFLDGKLKEIKNVCSPEFSKLKEHATFKEIAKSFEKYIKEHKINLE
jgi:hypothetical protein